MFRYYFFIVFILCTLSVKAQTSKLEGQIICCDTKKALKHCVLEIVESGTKIQSDKDGYFRFNDLPEGQCLLSVSVSGYTEKIIAVPIPRNTEKQFQIELCPADYLEIPEVIVSASRINRNLKDEPITVQVIDAKTIENAHFPNFAHFLEQELAGIDFNNNGGHATINMLGFDAKYVLFLIDGERIAGETFDNIDYNRIDVNNIERVEVIKGAASSLYGSNAIGGVINIITKKPEVPLQISASSQYGSLNEQNHNLSLGTKQKWGSLSVSSFFKMINPYLLKDTEPLRQEYNNGNIVEQSLKETYIAGFTSYGINPKLSFQISPKTKNEVYGGYYFQERNIGGYEGYKIRDQFNNYRIGVKSETAFNPNHQLTVSASLDDYQKLKYYKLIETKEKNYDNIIWRASAIYNHKLFKKHANIVGAEMFSENLLTFMFESDGDYSREEAQNYALFAQQEWQLSDKFTLVTGERLDYHSQFRAFPTFRLSGMYKILPSTKLRGGYSGGFRSPTLKELYTDWFHPYGGGFQIIGNSKMKAEKSHNFNLSSDFSYKRLDITLLGQYSAIDEKIDLIWLSNDTVQYQNRGNTSVISSELSVSYRFKFNLNLSGAYSFALQTPEKHSIVRPHSFTLRAAYTPKNIMKFPPTVSISGKFFSGMDIFGTTDISDENNLVGVDNNKEEYRINYEAYTIWRLQLAVPLPYHFAIGAGINNLFNYKTKFSSFYSNISPGRTYYISLKWHFNLKKEK